jgi:ABC-type cobalt transport system substrate-binding protein
MYLLLLLLIIIIIIIVVVVVVVIINILRHVDPLLGSDSELSKYTTAVTEYWLRKQACFHSNS